ncbi:MAG: hypothetical protein CMO04_15365 [Thalassospira sp.]|nr:hypothetical protein [Thalassospira sp.]
MHQHILCARLDMAIDGHANSAVECNTFAETPGPSNPYGNAYFEQETVLETEMAAARRANPPTQRYWKVVNPNKLGKTGRPVGYKLDATHCVTPFIHPESPSGKRAGFIQNHVWFTAYDAEERFPAGDFMNHSDGKDGLPDFIKQDRSLTNTDLVMWHVFGLHHQVRMEDFPVQPCVTTGFKLMPMGFFDGNPAINLPPEKNKASCNANA